MSGLASSNLLDRYDFSEYSSFCIQIIIILSEWMNNKAFTASRFFHVNAIPFANTHWLRETCDEEK